MTFRNFFVYYDHAKSKGDSDERAYHYAITEDMYTPDGTLLGPDDPRPDGMCYHPQDMLTEVTIWQYSCPICGLLLTDIKKVHDNPDKWWFCDPPRKIMTHSEWEELVFAGMGEDGITETDDD